MGLILFNQFHPLCFTNHLLNTSLRFASPWSMVHWFTSFPNYGHFLMSMWRHHGQWWFPRDFCEESAQGIIMSITDSPLSVDESAIAISMSCSSCSVPVRARDSLTSCRSLSTNFWKSSSSEKWQFQLEFGWRWHRMIIGWLWCHACGGFRIL